MNPWSQKSIELANTTNYLDQLQLIYPIEEADRNISPDILESISKAFRDGDTLKLLTELLDLDKFPYKDSYVSFLRKDRTSISRNPQTVQRIIDTLYKMGLDEILEGVQEHKESNQRRGTQFRSWAMRNFERAKLSDFTRSREGILILDASEAQSKEFCRSTLHIDFEKAPDLVSKVGEKYVVGEAKFSSDSGGNQDGAFRDGIELVTNTTGRAFKVFLLDGVIWLGKKGRAITAIQHSTAPIFSATLLPKFFEELKES
jgi:hypothetical protein